MFRFLFNIVLANTLSAHICIPLSVFIGTRSQFCNAKAVENLVASIWSDILTALTVSGYFSYILFVIKVCKLHHYVSHVNIFVRYKISRFMGVIAVQISDYCWKISLCYFKRFIWKTARSNFMLMESGTKFGLHSDWDTIFNECMRINYLLRMQWKIHINSAKTLNYKCYNKFSFSIKLSWW